MLVPWIFPQKFTYRLKLFKVEVRILAIHPPRIRVVVKS